MCLLILRHNYMCRPSLLAIFRMYMRNLSISYNNVCGEFTVCWVGWVRVLVLCWRIWRGLGLFRELCESNIHAYLQLCLEVGYILICTMVYW